MMINIHATLSPYFVFCQCDSTKSCASRLLLAAYQAVPHGESGQAILARRAAFATSFAHLYPREAIAMQFVCRSCVVALICVLLCAASRGDDAGGWKLPNLNPFSRPAGPPTSSRVS